MFPEKIKLIIVLFICLFLAGNKPVKLNYPLQKVVSLAPNITEMIYLLGAEDKLVGISDSCDHPQDVETKERTGPFGNPDLEKLVILNPDVIFYSEVKDVNFERKIANLGLPLVQIKIENFADLQYQLLQLGNMLGKEKKAKEIVKEWEAILRRAHLDAKWQKKVKVYFELWRRPLITVGKKSYIHEIIELAGGENIAGKMESPYPKPPEEFIIGADPELIIIGHKVTGKVEYPKSWQEVTAVKNNLIVSDVDLDLLLRPGPRLFTGLKIIQKKIAAAREKLDGEQ